MTLFKYLSCRWRRKPLSWLSLPLWVVSAHWFSCTLWRSKRAEDVERMLLVKDIKNCVTSQIQFPICCFRRNVVLFALNFSEKRDANIIGNYHSSIFPKADVWMFPFEVSCFPLIGSLFNSSSNWRHGLCKQHLS